MSSLVLFANDLEATVAFYRALGVPLVDEDHGGVAHQAAELAGIHFAIYPAETAVGATAPAWRSGSSVFPGFYVGSLDDTMGALDEVGSDLLESHQLRPWGCRVVARDPDGRAIEINQREHCR